MPLIVVPGICFKTVFSSFFDPRSSDLDRNSTKLQEITSRSCLDRSGPSKTTKNNQKTGKTKSKKNQKIRKNGTTISILKSMNFHDPWVGTDTTGPGEAVSAIGGANLEAIT